MMIIIVALLMGVLSALLLFVPRKSKSECYSKKDQPTRNDKVYDVTSYVEEHPGGDAILAHAGDDSTEGFFGPQHATRVFDMIDDFYVGDVAK